MSGAAIDGPLVSVIVAAFNAERTLAETLRSALAQSHRNIEVIVVDDGSTDGTAEIAARFAAEDDRVTLIRKTNGGASSARNAALAQAKGDYVAPLDADDIWHPSKLEKQVAVARRAASPPGFVYAFFRRIDEAGTIVESGVASCFRGHVIHQHLHRNFVGAGSSTLMLRSAVTEASGYDERLDRCEDYFLQLKIASRHPIDVVPEYLVGYRITPGSLTSNHDGMFEAWKTLRRLLRDSCPGVKHSVDAWTHGRRCFDAGEVNARRGNYLACAALLLRAAWSDPVGTFGYARYRVARRLRRRSVATAADPIQSFSEARAKRVIGRDPHEDSKGTERLRRFEARRFATLAKLDQIHAERLRQST